MLLYKKQILLSSHHSVLVVFVGRNLFTYHSSNIVDLAHDQGCVCSTELVLITHVLGYHTKCCLPHQTGLSQSF